jgi:hypothetical protein
LEELQPTITAQTEEYDGSTWTAGGTMNTARRRLGGAGTQTAALGFGGDSPIVAATEEYDGSTWTSNPTGLNTARDSLAGCGIQTAALGFGGYSPPPVTGATEEWLGAGAPTTVTITAS